MFKTSVDTIRQKGKTQVAKMQGVENLVCGSIFRTFKLKYY